MKKIKCRKILLFILLSFGFSWTIAILIKLTGSAASPYSKTNLALSALYMYGPAFAVFIIKKLSKESNLLSLKFNITLKQIKDLLCIPLFFICILLISFMIIWILGNNHIIDKFGQIDFSSEGFSKRSIELIEKLNSNSSSINETPSISPILLFFLFIMQSSILGGIINSFVTFGEEYGWRGFLLKEVTSLGFIKSSLFIGVIWGIWHTPLIIMGHNYPSYPILGILIMCIFTISISPIFTYITYKTQTLIAPCLFHGMINSIGLLFPLYIENGNDLYSSIGGLSTIFANLIITIFILLFDKKSLQNFHMK